MTGWHAVLLFGSPSSERRVSVATAQNLIRTGLFQQVIYQNGVGELYLESHSDVLNHSQPFLHEYEPKGQFIGRPNDLLSSVNDQSVFFLGFHGSPGEDGRWQRFLEGHGLRFTGCSSWASYLCYHKDLTRRWAQQQGFNVPAGQAFQWDQLKKDPELVPISWFPIVVKPTDSGSSVGLYRFDHPKQFYDWLVTVDSYPSSNVLVESFVSGREITVGVRQGLDGQWSVIGLSEVRLLGSKKLFDYSAKYLGQDVQEITPAPLNTSQQDLLSQTALRMAQVFGLFGYARVDFILTEDQRPVLLEINTLPGLTQASFIPQQLDYRKQSLTEFVQEQILLGYRRYEFHMNQPNYWQQNQLVQEIPFQKHEAEIIKA